MNSFILGGLFKNNECLSQDCRNWNKS